MGAWTSCRSGCLRFFSTWLLGFRTCPCLGDSFRDGRLDFFSKSLSDLPLGFLPLLLRKVSIADIADVRKAVELLTLPEQVDVAGLEVYLDQYTAREAVASFAFLFLPGDPKLSHIRPSHTCGVRCSWYDEACVRGVISFERFGEVCPLEGCIVAQALGAFRPNTCSRHVRALAWCRGSHCHPGCSLADNSEAPYVDHREDLFHIRGQYPTLAAALAGQRAAKGRSARQVDGG